LPGGNHQNRAEHYHDRCRGQAKRAGIDAEAESRQGEQDAEHRERQSKASGHGERTQRMGGHRGRQHDRYQGQHAGRQDRQKVGDERQGERGRRDQRLWSRSAAIEASLVSPTERPCSLAPLKTISVDCIWAPNSLTTGFIASKSTRKILRSLNFGSAVSFSRIGFCALQVGHQSAWISTRMGLPCSCAALKASAENGTALLAQAGARVNTKAAVTIAPLRNLRVNIVVSSCSDFALPKIGPSRPTACGRNPVTIRMLRMLPHDARGEARLASGRLDVFLQKTVSISADVSGSGKGPGPASV